MALCSHMDGLPEINAERSLRNKKGRPLLLISLMFSQSNHILRVQEDGPGYGECSYRTSSFGAPPRR